MWDEIEKGNSSVFLEVLLKIGLHFFEHGLELVEDDFLSIFFLTGRFDLFSLVLYDFKKLFNLLILFRNNDFEFANLILFFLYFFVIFWNTLNTLRSCKGYLAILFGHFLVILIFGSISIRFLRRLLFLFDDLRREKFFWGRNLFAYFQWAQTWLFYP